MSKYQPLSERLTGHTAHEWRASFSEIEDLLGFPLPKAARAGRSWWTGQDKPHTRAWMTSGWEVGEVDPPGGFVTFRRPVSEVAMQTPSGEPPAKVQPLPMKIAAEGASIAPRAKRWGLAAAIAAGAAVVTGAAVAIGMARRRPPSQPSA
jgi:hypothetical protein